MSSECTPVWWLMMNSLTNTKLFEDHLRHSQLVLTVQSHVTEGRELHLPQLRFWELPTYPFPKPTLTLTSHLGQNVGLGEG